MLRLPRWLFRGDRLSESVDTRVLQDMGERRSLAPGEVLVHEGEESDAVYVVIEGTLGATVRSSGGELGVGEVNAGEVIGEVAAIAGLRRSATVRAIGPARVAVIDRHDFAEWLAEHPERGDRIALEVRHRLNRGQVAEMAVQVFGVAAAEMVPDLISAAEWVDIAAGDVLFHEGDEPDAAYFILSGRLQATTTDGNGATRILNDLGRWEVVGELAIVQQGPRSATVTAMRDTTLARFSLGVFERLLMEHPALMLMVVRRMVTRLAATGPRARSTVRSVALVLADPSVADPEAGVTAGMLAGVSRLGTCAVVSSESLDRVIGREGIAQSLSSDVGSTRISQYLDETESAHDHLVYVCDPTPSGWTRRAMQRADTIVVVVPSIASAAAVRAVEAVLDAARGTQVPKWVALVDRAGLERPTPAARFALRDRFDEVHHLRRGNADDLARLGRLSLGCGYGLVLGGGGARGFGHVGVLRAMYELGIPIDRVGGASMGSIFAAGAALVQDADEIAERSKKYFNRLFDYTVPVVSLLKAKRITANLETNMEGIQAEDMWVPFFCVSTNLTKSTLHVHRDGDLLTAVRASIAIPGVLPPVPFNDDLLVDGGVLDNVPADVMRLDRSISTVIASDVAPPVGPGTRKNYGMFLSGWQALRQGRGRNANYPGMGSVLIRTMITSSESRRTTMRRDGTADLYLDLEMQGVGLLEFEKMSSTMSRGYAAAKPLLETWLATRPEFGPA